MRRLFSLLPLLLPLPNLVQAADPVCTLENRVCAENNNSGKCIRYENTFTCVRLNPAGSRCTVDANPTLSDCTLSAPVCSAESGGICLETTTDFVCKSEPSGEGIRIDDTSVTVSYSKETKGEIPAGCIIGAEVCLDDDARDIEVENWEGHFVSANPVCWVTERTILCPSVDGAASCQKLELAGCQKLTDPVCETEEHGVCVRWSSTYRCTRDEVIGDDIITDDVVTTPGDVTEDDSACRKELEDAAARGENCTVNSKVCVKTDPTGVLPCLEYRTTMTCTSSSTDTCAPLKNLSGSGDCMLAAEPECTLTDADGNCRRTESTYVCTESVTSESVSPATFLKAMTVTNWRESDDCLLDDGSVMTASLSLLSRASTTDNSSGCILASRTCIEGEGLRFVEGRPAYSACWAWEEKWTCRAEGNECLEYEKDPSCKLVSETCSDGSTDCPRPSRVYSCTRPGLSASVGQVCDGQICVGDQCQDVGDTADGDFIDAILQLEIGRQLSVYGDTNVNEFFGGTVSTCRDRMAAETCCRADAAPNTSNAAFGQYLLFGVAAGVEFVKWIGSPYVYDLLSWSDKTSWLLNKIYGSSGTGAYSPTFSFWGATAQYSESAGWTFNFSSAGFVSAMASQFWNKYQSCRATDQRTALAKTQRLCHYVGTTCEKKVTGLGCVETAEKHVCFNSRLARILNEQGRPQLGRDFGNPIKPDARGFTIDEFAKLDFSKMDLSEFIADIVKEVTARGNISAEAAAARARERIEAMVKGELATTAKLPGASDTVASKDQPTKPDGTGGPSTPSSK